MNCEVKRLTLPDGAPAVKNPGSLSPPTPSRAARRHSGRGADTIAQPCFALPHWTREVHVVPRLMRRFAKVSDHDGENTAL